MAKYVIAVDHLIEVVAFKPGLLYRVNIEIFDLHGHNEVLVPCVVKWFMRKRFVFGVTGSAAEAMCILGGESADDNPLFS